MDRRAIVSDIQEGSVASTGTDYESVFVQQIKCSKSQLLIEVGTILVTLLPNTEDETAYRLCWDLSRGSVRDRFDGATRAAYRCC